MKWIAILLLAGASAFEAEGEVLRTCREIRDRLVVGQATDARFDVTGTVVVSANPTRIQLIAFADESGATLLDLAGLHHDRCVVNVRPGERYHMTGHFSTSVSDTLARIDDMTKICDNAPVCIPSVNGVELTNGDCVFSAVRIRGRVLDVFADEIDPEWSYFVLHADGRRVYVFFTRDSFGETASERMIDAAVEITGICNRLRRGARQVLGPNVIINGASAIRILQAAPDTPFDVPPLEDVRGLNAITVEGFGRRKVTGTVQAVESTGRFILSTDDGRTVNVDPITVPPVCGEHVEVCGRVSTDVYHVNLHRPIWRTASGVAALPPTTDMSALDLLTDANRNPMIKAELHGAAIRIEGIVRSLPTEGGHERRLHLESDGVLVPIDPGWSGNPFVGLERGSRISTSGICCMEISTSARLDKFPRIGTFSLILRRPDDLVVIERPSWWTPRRLLTLAGLLLFALLGIIVWNVFLNRLVERRTRELMRARVARDEANLKTEERMRLAVELHDTISQEMAGVAMQIDAAEMAAENRAPTLPSYLASARMRLQSCRQNLRNCLWDLRNRPFDTRYLADAIRRTVAPHLNGVKLSVESRQSCRELSDNSLHAVLCIVRELTVNAVKNGQAKTIKVAASLTNKGLSLRVSDDGCGFDPLDHPGPKQGHFGLLGVSERINRLEGSLKIESAPGHGTVITIDSLNPDS